MRVIVFGPSSKLGRQVWRKALDAGHHVTVFGRWGKTLAKEEPALSAVMGDSFDAARMSGVISLHDAVMVCLGTEHKELVTPTTGTDIIVDAMVRHDVKRLVVATTTGDGLDETQIPMWARLLFPFVRMWSVRRGTHLLGGHESQEALIKKSPLDWTIVRAPVVNDKLAPGFVERSTNVSREDVAICMVQQLTDLANNHRTITARDSEGSLPTSDPAPSEPLDAEPTPSQPLPSDPPPSEQPAEPSSSEQPAKGKFEDYPLAPGGGPKKRRSWRSR